MHAAELGLSQKEVVDNVITALNSNTMIAPNYWVDHQTGNDYFLTVQYYENGRPAIHNFVDLKKIPLRAPESSTKPTTLGLGRETLRDRSCSRPPKSTIIRFSASPTST